MNDATDTPALLNPTVIDLARHVAILDAALGQERQQHVTVLAQRDAEVRGLTARLEAAEAETEACRRDLDRGWTEPMTVASGGITVTTGGVNMNGTSVAEARA